MLQMRDIGCDWVNRETQKDDYLSKKEQLIVANRDFPRRAVAPSLTQMHLLRRMMHTIFSPNAPGMQGGMFSEKDLKKEWIPVWEEFYRNSYYFPALLVFPETIRSLSDLSYLWYREFYLEVTKSVQFPISQSMPWILCETIISTPNMKENIFFPMDIYNDAAALALYDLKQQVTHICTHTHAHTHARPHPRHSPFRYPRYEPGSELIGNQDSEDSLSLSARSPPLSLAHLFCSFPSLTSLLFVCVCSCLCSVLVR